MSVFPKQAITTKYLGPGNVRGSRIKATSASGKSVVVGYDHSLDAYENHEAAAYALCKKLGWDVRLVGGGLKGGYVFVITE